MPTRNVSLTREQDAFISMVVEAGEYQNASEAMRDALRALQQRRREDKLRLTALRAEIAKGIRDLDEGDFVELDDAEIEQYLARLKPRRSRRKHTAR
jgi:antitoxin ParD1/3/4